MRSYENGELCYEHGLKNGKKHGTEYMWMGGKLLSAEPYVDGASHGVAQQWSPDGKLIGTYRMCHGTGLDLWRMQREDGSVFLTEATCFKKGRHLSFQWFINEDQKTVTWESFWNENGLHGVQRQWNLKGRLRRGFPQYYIDNRRVSKRQYVAACKKDPATPPLRPEDDKPQRTFPPEVARHLCFPKHKK